MIEPLSRVAGAAAPLPFANIDTDKILPARFLKTISRRGLGSALFATLREDPAFILEREPWTNATILIAGENFGCGSSREHAPWALLDFGIRCVIAPGFADIFYNNCFNNGILPVILRPDEVAKLLALTCDAATAQIEVDLVAQTIEDASGHRYAFEIDAARKAGLLLGRGEIEATLRHLGEIDRFELMRTDAAYIPAIDLALVPGLRSGEPARKSALSNREWTGPRQ